MPVRQHVIAKAPLKFGRVSIAKGTTGTVERVSGLFARRFTVRFQGPGFDIVMPGLTLAQVGLVGAPSPVAVRVPKRRNRR